MISLLDSLLSLIQLDLYQAAYCRRSVSQLIKILNLNFCFMSDLNANLAKTIKDSLQDVVKQVSFLLFLHFQPFLRLNGRV
jgi:hypothetical protein